jgi:galactonate dehydratase
VVNGYIEIPERPGLGIELNIEEILKHPYHRENVIPLFQPGWERREGRTGTG